MGNIKTTRRDRFTEKRHIQFLCSLQNRWIWRWSNKMVYPHIYIYIWVNYNISLTWIKAILGWFPLLTMIPVRSQWGRYNLPRYIQYIYIYTKTWGDQVTDMRFATGDDHNSPRRKDSWGMVQYVPWYNMCHGTIWYMRFVGHGHLTMFRVSLQVAHRSFLTHRIHGAGIYSIYANMWGILMENVTMYSIHGSYG